MYEHKLDVLCVGDVVTDAFIKLLPHEAEIKNDPKNHHPLLCMTFGTKIPFEEAIVIDGVGNSPNAAVAFSRLGLNSALYANVGDDFGLSFFSEEEHKDRISKAEYEASSLTADEYQQRLKQLEVMIVPFLTRLHQTGDKEYIYWPNRKPAIEKQIEKILKLTRE